LGTRGTARPARNSHSQPTGANFKDARHVATAEPSNVKVEDVGAALGEVSAALRLLRSSPEPRPGAPNPTSS